MKALIIGGGIAGPAAAIALDKAGIASEIYEAYPADADVDAGAFLTIAANGQDALRAIDIERQVAEVSFPTERLRLFDAHGVKVVDVPLGAGRPSSRSVTRAELSRVLRSEAIARRVPVFFGKRLISVPASAPGGGVTAAFSDGTEAAGDLLIGADGVHSLVRTLIDPAAPGPRYTGLVIACGYAPLSDAVGPGGYSMYYGSRAFLGCTPGPDRRIWWFARLPASSAQAAQLVSSGTPELIADFFDGDATPTAELIRGSSLPLTITEARDIARLPAWSANDMIVIGDAAHPVSPMTTQGASLAIEDAVILAQCLRDVSPVPNALQAFEGLRRERAEAIARSGASGENPGPPAPAEPRPGPRPSPVLDHHIDWEAPVRT